MPITVHYRLRAAPGREAELEAALSVLGDAVLAVEGCEGSELLRDRDQPALFVFIERWASPEARDAGGRAVGKQCLPAVLAAIEGKPQCLLLDPLLPKQSA